MKQFVIFPSAARTASVNGDDVYNPGHRGVHVVIDCTVDPASASVTFTIQGKDPASGKYYTLLASAAITGTGTTVLRVFPGSTVTANLAANDALPAVWRVVAVAGNADSMTYSVGASYLN